MNIKNEKELLDVILSDLDISVMKLLKYDTVKFNNDHSMYMRRFRLLKRELIDLFFYRSTKKRSMFNIDKLIHDMSVFSKNKENRLKVVFILFDYILSMTEDDDLFDFIIDNDIQSDGIYTCEVCESELDGSIEDCDTEMCRSRFLKWLNK